MGCAKPLLQRSNTSSGTSKNAPTAAGLAQQFSLVSFAVLAHGLKSVPRRGEQFYSVCIPAPIAYIQLSETCQLNVQHAHVHQYFVEALLTQGKVSKIDGSNS